MRIKTFYQFNEGIGSSIRSVFNKDEETVEGIIKNASKLKKSDITLEDDEYNSRFVLNTMFKFSIDEFDILVQKREILTPGIRIHSGDDYFVKVDSVKLKASNSISKKLFKIISKIYYEEDKKKEEESHIRKDANLHFRK